MVKGFAEMACVVEQEDTKTVFRLVGHLDDRDFDHIEIGFETVIEKPDAFVVIDFAELQGPRESLSALLGMLRLHACRAGAQLELRHMDAGSVPLAVSHWR